MNRSLLITAGGLFALFLLSGCNTDKMWADDQEVEGPVTTWDDTEGVEIPDVQIAGAREVDLVEEVLSHRVMYRRSLTLLRDYYRDHGYYNKQQWADAELDGLEKVRPFKYILSAEIPAASLRPTNSIAEADALYQRGLELLKKGGHGVPALYRRDVMLEALEVFQSLVEKYPSSDKIDDAAFYCGEILKEYFDNQERLAVRWYERARTWDPNTPHPVLFQTAVIYDFRMHDRAKALELYHRVLEEETGNKSNAAFASRRIYQLTEDKGNEAWEDEPRGVPAGASTPSGNDGGSPSAPASAGTGRNWQADARG